jgi:hypothetical protein
MEAGSSYWPTWEEFVSGELLGKGLINEDDRRLYVITDSIEQAADEICGFYSNYHSQRYVRGRLVLRLRHAPTPEHISALNEEFSDVLVDGTIEMVDASESEMSDDDALDCARLRLHFNRRSYGRLRELIDKLNGFVYETPGRSGPMLSGFLDLFMADPD